MNAAPLLQMRLHSTWALVPAGLLAVTLPALAAHVTLLRTPDGGIQPQALVDSRGAVHLIYFKGEPAGGDIYYVVREPGQTNFSRPLKVNSRSGTAIAMGTIRGAQLALGKNDRVHVAWNGTAPAQGRYLDAPMLYTRLNDAGSAFEPERNLIHSARGLDGGGSLAADKQGNVFVMWHAPEPGNTNGEAGRAVFMAQSSDEGRTFAPERRISPRATGACGCCGMKAFADNRGDVFALYRGAAEETNRDEILLRSPNRGVVFQIIDKNTWHLSSCPMSSAFISQDRSGVLAAAETHGRVYFVRVQPTTGEVSAPSGPQTKGQHPVVVGNGRGEVLLAWTQGTAWGKGGAVAWQVYGADGQPTAAAGRADGLPVWSLATAFTEPGGDFVIVY